MKLLARLAAIAFFATPAFAQYEIRTKSELNHLLGGWHVQLGVGATATAYMQNLAQEHRNLQNANGSRLPLSFNLAAYHRAGAESKILLGPAVTFNTDFKTSSSLLGSSSQSINTALLGASLVYTPSGSLDRGLIMRGDFGLAGIQADTVNTFLGSEERKSRGTGRGAGALAGVGYITSPWQDYGPSVLYMLSLTYIQASAQELGRSAALTTALTASAFF